MMQRFVDRFLDSVKRVRQLVFLVQLTLIGAGAWMVAKAAHAVAAKYLWYHGLAAGIALSAVLLILLLQRLVRFFHRTEPRIAHELDLRFALKDRLSTYIEIRRQDHPFLEALANDTETKLRGVSAWTAARPVHAIAPCVLVAAFLFVMLVLTPYLPVPQSIAAGKQEQKQIHEEAKQLARSIGILQNKKESSPEMKRFLSEAFKEAKELQKPGVEKADALKRLNALQDKLAHLQQKGLAEKQQQLAKALQDMSARQRNKSGDAPTREEIEKLSREIQEALGKSGKNLDPSGESSSDAPPSQMSRQEMEKMKKALEQYKKDAAEAGKRMAEMQKALENAQKGIATGEHRVTSDSRIKDRDIEKGGGGVDDGPGTTNKDVGPQRFDTKKHGPQEYAEDRTKAQYEQIYKGERIEAANDPLMLGSKWNDKSELKTQYIRSFGLESDPAAAQQGGGLAPQNREESVIRKEKVPASYQKMVKEYFESIQQNQHD